MTSVDNDIYLNGIMGGCDYTIYATHKLHK